MILHSNQPKICRHDGGGIIRDALPDGEVRGARSHQFRGDRVGRRLKNEIKLIRALNNFFLSWFKCNSKDLKCVVVVVVVVVRRRHSGFC